MLSRAHNGETILARRWGHETAARLGPSCGLTLTLRTEIETVNKFATAFSTEDKEGIKRDSHRLFYESEAPC